MIEEERLQDDLENMNITEAWTSVLEEVKRGTHENYADIARGLGDDGPRGESNTRRKASFFKPRNYLQRKWRVQSRPRIFTADTNTITMSEEYAVPATGALILNDKDKIFLMKSPKWDNQWLVPGGKVEKGDSMRETIRKEIREETNLEITDIEFLEAKDGGNPDDFERDTHLIFLNFVCRAETNDVELDQREAVDYKWIDPREALDNLNLNDSTADFIENYLEKD